MLIEVTPTILSTWERKEIRAMTKIQVLKAMPKLQIPKDFNEAIGGTLAYPKPFPKVSSKSVGIWRLGIAFKT